jgi:tetratricopeptide (TPR) repeat protein
MSIENILSQLDNLLNDCKLKEAEIFLLDSIEESIKNNEYANAITLYNEQIGYYRDCGKFDESIDSCNKVLELIKNCNLENTPEHATTLLNVANAYRASGNLEKSFSTYEKVKKIYDNSKNIDKKLYASYYNNLSLLNQEANDFESAYENQKKALSIVLEIKDYQKIAISKTNIAVSLIRLNKISEAEKMLGEALEYFTGLTPSDFHYSAALSAMGDVCYHQGKYNLAVKYYEMALSETELHMGKNNFYDVISENLNLAKSKSEIDYTNIKGIEICRKFYEYFGKPMIHRNFKEYENAIVCGMVGEGSECFGFDDEFSKDHDFGAGFCVWLDDDLYEKIGDKLQKAYDLLPKSFMGTERIKSIQSKKRVGVFSSTKFYTDLLECDEIPQTINEWIEISPEKLALVTNGSIFTQTNNKFTEIRKYLLNKYPESVRLKNIAQNIAMMSQTGQYNYNRMLNRNDIVTAQICYNEFVKSSLKSINLIDGKYYPYYKWLYKSCENSEIKELFAKKNSILEDKVYDEIILPVCRIIKNKIADKFGINIEDDYLDLTAKALSDKADEIILKENLAYKIAKMEFEAFDSVQNEGGRANCQDDWETFSIMRVSQYLTWEIEMLKQYINDFESAIQSGRNLITEKYARMMSSTVPEKYKEIENSLPKLEEDTVAICNAICEIQVSWMEEFAEKYPKMASQARAIHTYEDTEYSTSFETYLRGELLTYSREMMGMYAGFVVNIAKNNKNLTYMTMENTALLYGYKSLDEAEEKL